MKKTPFYVPLLISLLACNGSSNSSTESTTIVSTTSTILPITTTILSTTTTAAPQSFCDNWHKINTDGYQIFNNVWGISDKSDYQQCIYGTALGSSSNTGWTWSIPSHYKESVSTYPEIIFGARPSDSSPVPSTTTKLPIKVTNIRSLSSTFRITSTATGKFNTSFDIWLTDSAAPSKVNRKHEIMIWLNAQNWTNGNHLEGSTTIDGIEYKLYSASFSKDRASWKYWAFVSSLSQYQGTINLKNFIDYLIVNKINNNDYYLACVELGNEIYNGEGGTQIHEYSINIEP